MSESFCIGTRDIGTGGPLFFIAEAGVNHNGDPALARKLVDVAVEAGADAVKFQTFRAERLATINARKADYQAITTGGDENQFQMLKKLELSHEDFRALDRYCRMRGILFLSTPFDEESADFLESLDMAAFKIPSGEVTNHPFLSHVAKKRRPMIISTGMATLGEVEAAVAAVLREGTGAFALLHCVSEYPASPADVNLKAMATLHRAFGKPVGYSDHTAGIEISLAAAALGACIVEKHFTLDRTLAGPDHLASLEPVELAVLVRGIRTIESAIGDGRKRPSASEMKTAAAVRRSLVAARDIAEGEILTAEMIIARRPGTGISPADRGQLVGRRARVRVCEGELFAFEMLS